MEVKMSKSTDNLQTAFAGESMANRRYLAFAKKADDAGLPQIARLFRAAASAETVHATNHLRAMDGLKDTAANLQVCIAGENYEVVTMYPDMLADAAIDGDKRATQSFNYAWQTEKIHEALYREAAETLASGKDLPEAEYYICPVCGHTHRGKLEEGGRCPVCNTPFEKFSRVD
jgi:rubrerythrin